MLFTGKLCVSVLSFCNESNLKTLSQTNSMLVTLLFQNIDLMWEDWYFILPFSCFFNVL